MEWRVPRDRILRIDVYWYRRRRKRKLPERQPTPEVLEAERLVRERHIRAYEERRREREAELGDA
jgi:hypothetical protein